MTTTINLFDAIMESHPDFHTKRERLIQYDKMPYKYAISELKLFINLIELSNEGTTK
jgi:hypothetical protein